MQNDLFSINDLFDQDMVIAKVVESCKRNILHVIT